MAEKSPQSIDDGQTHDGAGTPTTPRQGVRNLAGIFVIGLLLFGCLFACGLIAFANLRGAPASVAENPEVTRIVMATPEVPSAAGVAEEGENVALAPEAQPTAVMESTDGASIEAITAEDSPPSVYPETDPDTYVYNVVVQSYAAGYTAVMVTADGVFEVTGTPEEIAAVLAEGDSDFDELGPWIRIWRAANLEYTPWTYFFRMSCDAPLDGNAQWHQATELKIIAPEGGIKCHAQLRRDLVSSAQVDPDPYTVADLKNTGELAWFVDGAGDVQCGDETFALGLSTGEISVVQVPFEHQFDGVINLYFELAQGETVFLRQGEVISTEATCQLP